MIKIAEEANAVLDLIVSDKKKPGPAAESHSRLCSDKHKRLRGRYGVFKRSTEMTA